MSAVAARKAALAARLAAERAAAPLPTEQPIASSSRSPQSAEPSRSSQEVSQEKPFSQGSSRTTTPKREPHARPRRGGAKRSEAQKQEESFSTPIKGKRAIFHGIYENSDDDGEEPVLKQMSEEIMEVIDSEDDFDFMAVETVQTTPSGRPKKRRRVSVDEQRLFANFDLQQGVNICRIGVEQLGSHLAKAGPAVCISMKREEFFTFSGMALITPLQNAISIFSSVLTPSSASEVPKGHRLFAPLTSPLPVICPSGSPIPCTSNASDPASYGIPTEMLSGDRTLFLVQELDCGIDGIGQAVMTLGKVWPDRNAKGAFGLKGVHPILRAPDHAVYTHSTPESWSDALNSLSGAVTRAQSGEDEDEFGEYGSEMIDRSAPVLAIMKGQKRSGKSTFGRELVNRLLTRYETVAYLDCDLGQSEFSPGGSVGLYVVKSPLLGPSWTHPTIPARSHFIGLLNPRLQSEHYMECIASLLEHYRYEMQYPFDLSNQSSEKISEVVPLVINTQGWVKGLGADLLGQIETLVQATHTFIFASNEYENGDDNDNRQFAGEDYDAVPEHHIMGGFGRVMQLQAAPPSGLFSRFSPADSRTLATISYLHARLSREAPVVWDFSEPLVGMLPWEVSLQDAIKRIHLTGEGSDSIVEDDLGVALNGSLVGLLAYTGDVPEGERYEMGEPLPSSQNTTCVGLGLIRAVAPGDQSIQLLTPVAAEQFSSVNALVKGDLELPLCGSLDWRNSSVRVNEGGLLGVAWSEVPFLSIKPERGVGGGRRRLRRNIMRKNQAS